MILVGFPISIEEAFRLLKLDESKITSFYDTSYVENYLKIKNSALHFDYVDKCVCALGIPLNGMGTLWPPFLTVSEGMLELQDAKNRFLAEAKKLGMDLSHVTVAVMEDEDILLEHPEPILFGW